MDLKPGEKYNIQEISPGLCKHMPKKHLGDNVAGYHQQHRLVEKDQTTTFGNNHQNTRPDLVRTHSKEIKYEHFKANLRVEPTMTAKAKKTKELLASDLKKIGKSWVEAKLIARMVMESH